MAMHGFNGSDAQSVKSPVSTHSEGTFAARLGESISADQDAAVDIVAIAKTCRQRLEAEIAEIDAFITMADSLIGYRQRLVSDSFLAAGTLPTMTKIVEDSVDAIVDSDEVKAQDDDLAAATTIEVTDPVEDDVLVLFSDLSYTHNDELAPASFRPLTVVTPAEQLPVVMEKLRAVETHASDAGRVDIQIGQRLRQRRWMMGISKQQLADTLGVASAEIRNYEMGASRISTASMLNIATAMEVPVSYFFEGVDGQAADTDEARTTILSDKEALALVRKTPLAQNA